MRRLASGSGRAPGCRRPSAPAGNSLERDEGEYAYGGQLMLEGVPPFKLAYSMKLPGTDAGYAAIMALFGQTTAGIHLGFLLVNLATVALLFFVARRLLDHSHALIACACYALFSLSPGVLGLAGHATHLVTLAALGGMLVLLKARESGRALTFFGGGLLFGLAFLCKQPGLFFAMFGAAVILRDALQAPRSERGKRARNFAWFCLGGALPFLLTCWLMWRAGTFQRFWFWTVVYAQVHAPSHARVDRAQGLRQFPHAGWRHPLVMARGGGRAGLPPAPGGVAARQVPHCLPARLFAACFHGKFLFLAALFYCRASVLSLLIAIAVRSAARQFGGAISLGCFRLGVRSFCICPTRGLVCISPLNVAGLLYGANPFPEAVEIARYIREHSAPGSTIAVLGSEPEIFFHARRHSATGYIYMYEMMQVHQYPPPCNES